MPRRYAILDVFTKTRLEGNQLAVVLDCDGLDGQAMQKIAREFNLSETVFVLPAENAAHSAKVRIFTPGRELPFAGHPTVGTAVLLAERRFGVVEAGLDAVVVLEEGVGPVRCGVKLSPGAVSYAEFDVPRQSEPVETEPFERGAVADALGLKPQDIGFENHVCSAWSAGNPFIFVPVADLDAVRRARPNFSLWPGAFPLQPQVGVYVYTRETLFHDNSFHARCFTAGEFEDPATGSAVAAFAGMVNQFDDLPNGSHRYRIEQGFEMARPSLIDLEVEVLHSRLIAARIGGHAVLVGEGTFTA